MKYPGKKSNSGLAEFIINRIPETHRFVEGFGGSAHITQLLAKLVPEKGVMYDVYEINPETHKQLVQNAKDNPIPSVWFQCSDFIDDFEEAIRYEHCVKDVVFYLDPPYQHETIYRPLYGEYSWNPDNSDHERFLKLVANLAKQGAKVLISHPRTELFDNHLDGWHCEPFETVSRGGPYTEYLWRNFDHTEQELLCTEFVGDNFTQRQTNKRLVKAWLKKLKNMDRHRRQYVYERLSKFQADE